MHRRFSSAPIILGLSDRDDVPPVSCNDVRLFRQI
jgi:hypothetical protein